MTYLEYFIKYWLPVYRRQVFKAKFFNDEEVPKKIIYDGYVFTTFIGEDGITKTLTDYQIKSIVTHEQFESMEYKVGE